MIFSARISTRRLAQLCRRLATSLEAGVDARTVWAREAERATGPAARRHIGTIKEAAQAGDTLADALSRTGNYFPELLCELVAVGEQTGQLPEVFRQLADNYDLRLKLRREFRAAIAWPAIQLVLALAVIGLLILAMGIIGEVTGQTIDILGFGLVGPSGLAIYLGFLTAVGVCFALVLAAVRRGMVWTRPIQRLVMQIPGLGPVLRTLALSRLTWSLSLALEAGMDVRPAMKLALRSTRNALYTDRLPTIDAELAQGNSFHDALAAAGVFSLDLLDAVAVGEESGRLVESMALLSRGYHEQARAALKVLNTIAGVVVWLIVAGMIIALIFRLFSFYLGVLNEAAGGGNMRI